MRLRLFVCRHGFDFSSASAHADCVSSNLEDVIVVSKIKNRFDTGTVDEKDMVNIRQLILVPTTTLGVLEPMDIFNCHTCSSVAFSSLPFSHGHQLPPTWESCSCMTMTSPAFMDTKVPVICLAVGSRSSYRAFA